MPLQTDPADVLRFPIREVESPDPAPEGWEPDPVPTFLLRPLTAREEHHCLDLGARNWERVLYVLERALLGWENWPAGGEFETGPYGLVSDACIRRIPTRWRSEIASWLLNTINVTEDDLEK